MKTFVGQYLVTCHLYTFTVLLSLFAFYLDVAWFNEALERYHGQRQMAENIKEKRSIGMLLVDAIKMKTLLIPSPLRCLDVSNFLYCDVVLI